MCEPRINIKGIFSNSAKELTLGVEDAVLLLFVIFRKLEHVSHYLINQLLNFCIKSDY